jgi:hypothetical protein
VAPPPAWLQVARGAAIEGEERLIVEAMTQDELLVFDLA